MLVIHDRDFRRSQPGESSLRDLLAQAAGGEPVQIVCGTPQAAAIRADNLRALSDRLRARRGVVISCRGSLVWLLPARPGQGRTAELPAT